MTPGKFYRVHVHDLNNQGAWLEQADFPQRPRRDQMTADKLPKLNAASGGRFEIRIVVVRGSEEYYLSAWTETRESRCAHCQGIYAPYTNERFCSDKCYDAYPDEWPKVRC